MRRFSSALTRSAARGRPAGIPSRTATNPRPCDSPAVVKRNITLRYLPPEPPQPPPASTNLPIIAREPDSGPGSRDLRGVPPLHVVERGSGGEDSSPWPGGQGVRTHRRGGAGFGFVSVGSRTITRPLAVMPNKNWLVPVASRATRNGPTIGSRMGIEKGAHALRHWLPSNVSNTSMFASGRAANRKRLFRSVPPPQLGVQLPLGEKSWK